MSHEFTESWHERDQALFSRLEPIFKKIEEKPVYSLLASKKETREHEKQQFLSSIEAGSEYAPNLEPDFDENNIKEIEQTLLASRAEIKAINPASEQEVALKAAYRWKINEQIGGLRIALAAKRHDMRAFNAYNRFIYGSPNPSLVAEELDAIREDARQMQEDPAQQPVAQEVLGILERITLSASLEDFKVSPELFEQVKAAHQPYYDMALEGIEVPEFVKPEQGMEIVERILRNVGSDYTPVAKDRTVAGVNHGRQELEYAAKVEYPRPRFIGLYAGHEIGDHIYGRMKAVAHSFKLGAKGLDRIEISSEGKGVAAEQVAYDSLEEFARQERALTIGMRHLTAALALGVDGQPRTFAEVYRIAEPIFRLYGDKLGGDSKSAAYNLLSMRTMKGTSGRGAAYLKDFVYAEGVRQYWQLAQQSPELLPYLNEFRANLSNPRHIMVLQTLGLLPKFTSEENQGE